jgi:Tfp pilus assembly protein PilP
MRIIRQPVAVLIFVLAAGLCPAQTRTDPAPKTVAEKEAKSLLRKDLLQIRKQDAAPPTRNIFAPRAGFSRPGDVVRAGRPQSPVDFQAADESAATEETTEAPPVITVNLRYIGFIESPRRLVALVNFEGRAMAVVEGDVVGEGIRIGKVTRQQIEVVLPDSTTRTFSLEGE